MKLISIELDNNSSKSLYIQIYEHIREGILNGDIGSGEKLPSVRTMADMLDVSITTVRTAYDQLVVEGYLDNRPQSGFYVQGGAVAPGSGREENARTALGEHLREGGGHQYSDIETFDFVKWKKCMSAVLNETPELLLEVGDRQGEPELREEIARYLYGSRGVICTPDQIVISAGTQQLTVHLSRILKAMDITYVCTEDPGYVPVRNIFRDQGFGMSHIPVAEEGIEIERLPSNIRTAVYISPQNQFPTGTVMPVGRRHEILRWAEANDSIIIEDDYDSEFRYQSKPVPALQGMDNGRRVVYLGSFTSTLFPAVRISYMVLPPEMLRIFLRFRDEYDQTCSKTEQLTLARFMHEGYYQINLRRIRKLYSKKLREMISAISRYGAKDGMMNALSANSGMNVILRIRARDDMTDVLRDAAAAMGNRIYSLRELNEDGYIFLNLYYNQIPLGDIDDAVRRMSEEFRRLLDAPHKVQKA